LNSVRREREKSGTIIHTIRSHRNSAMAKRGGGLQVERATRLSRFGTGMQWTERPVRRAGCRAARPRSEKPMGIRSRSTPDNGPDVYAAQDEPS
jgi:hypothetical protein